jgi:hypothetical protein
MCTNKEFFILPPPLPDNAPLLPYVWIRNLSCGGLPLYNNLLWGRVCVCVCLTSSRGGLPFDAVSTAR